MRNAYLPKESQEQAAVIQWWRAQYPAKDILLFAIPNGGYRHIKTGVVLKREGVKAGVADLFLSIPTCDFHGLYIEMKRCKMGRQTLEQKWFQHAVEEQGYAYIVAFGANEAIEYIKNYLSNNFRKPTENLAV